MESMYDRTDTIGRISIYIDHLNNYQASLLIFDTLRAHLKKAFVVFDQKADETSTGLACDLWFGNDPEENENENNDPRE